MRRRHLPILAWAGVALLTGCGRLLEHALEPTLQPCRVTSVRLSLPPPPATTDLLIGTELEVELQLGLDQQPGSSCTDPTPTWSLSSTTVASVRPYGPSALAIAGRAKGTTKLTVSAGGQTASTFLAVRPIAPVPSFVSLSAAGETTCALAVSGEAYCWGVIRELIEADGAWWVPSGTIPFPSRQVAPTTFTSLDGRGSTACGRAANGILCWGSNTHGQLGIGSTEPRSGATMVTGSSGFRSVTTGGDHVCALDEGGNAYCWGANDVGQLGDSTMTSSSTPVPVWGGITFRSLSASGRATCGVSVSGDLYCWGGGQNESLRQTCEVSSGKHVDEMRCDPVPVRMQLDPNLRGAPTFSAVALGLTSDRGCALDAAGVPWCWGNYVQQRYDPTRPAPVIGTPPLTMVSVGVFHACGVAGDGSGYCWGSGPNGELGNGQHFALTGPVGVATSERLVAVSAGSVHTCAITGRGTALCWGDNARGLLGTGSDKDADTPVPVLGQP